MSKNQLRNNTESNRAKNRLSAPSAQPTGLAARLGRAPCRMPVPPIAPTPTRPAPAYEPRALSQAPHAQPSAQPSAQLPYAQWAVAHFRFCILFFSFVFFISFSHWKIQKNIFIYFLSFSSTPINLLKFISSILLLFFYFPTNQTNCLNLFYLFSCYSLHIVNSKVRFPTCLCAIYLSTQTFTSHKQHVIHTKHIHTTIHQST